MVEVYQEKGICIESDFYSIFGILTSSNIKKTGGGRPLIILVPAISGTRIGPQRIFVEVAREVAELGYSSFRIDMDLAGDSYQLPNVETSDSNDSLISWYSNYLDEVTRFLKEEPYTFDNYLLLSISLGCEPILRYAMKKSYNSVIFLSPTYLDYVNRTSVNKKNLKSYWYKIFMKQTWIKLLHFDIKWKKIIRNVIPKKKIIKNHPQKGMIMNKPIEVFSVYGELDKEFVDSKNYWNKLANKGILSLFTYELIKGSDHNFFGYQFKKDVKFVLKEWLSKAEWKK